MTSRRLRLPAFLALLTALLSVAPLAAQRPPALRIAVGEAESGWRPVLEVGPLLEDGTLRDALASGLPLRFNLRVELWQRGLFDRLVATQETFLALVRDPLTRDYTLDAGEGEQRFATLAGAQTAVQAGLRADELSARGSGSGRYYYLARLEVETLSLSDLEELRRWLRGEVRPAVEGGGSAGRALQRGLRRVLVRVIGLPTRSYEARSPTFVPG